MTSTTEYAGTQPAFLKENPKDRITVFGMRLPLIERTLLWLGLVVVVILPVFFDGYTIYEYGKILMYALAVLGLNILTGFNGQFSLGHSAFFAVGAYTTAILMDQLGMPYWMTILPAAGTCFIAGFLFGLPALRLEGLFLALATFALAIATPQILKWDGISHLTGGVQGIVLDTPYPPAWVDSIAVAISGQELSVDRWKYIFTAIVVIVMFWLAANLIRSRTGRALIAIRDNPLSAKTMGINNAIFKSACFGVSAMYTGVAGSLFAIMDEYLAPESFTFAEAIKFLVGGVVGGIASLFGAVFGGAFVLYVPNFSDTIARLLENWIANPQGLSWTVYGLFLIFAVYVMPMGATGLIQILVRKIGVRR